jgi:PAS domain S-box-containing protein
MPETIPLDKLLLKSLSNSLDIIIFELSSEGEFLDVWYGDEKQLFMPAEKFLHKNLLDIMPNELGAQFYKALQESILYDRIVEVAYKSPIDDKYFNARFGILNQEKKSVAVLISDITAYKTTEERIKESEEKYRKLFQNSLDVVTVLDPTGKVKFDSFSKLTAFGYEAPIVGQSIFDFVHPDERESAIQHFTTAMHQSGVYGPVEFRFKTQLGDWKYIEVIGINLFDEPLINGYVVNSRDINERRKMELALSYTNAKLNAIIESTDDIIFAVDTHYNYIAFNNHHIKAIKEFYGIDVKLGDPALRFELENTKIDRDNLKPLFDRCLQGESFKIRYDLTHLNNAIKFSEISFNPIKEENGEISGIAIFSKDITEQVVTQKALEQAKDTAEAAARAKSDFLSNMSHEIRTPINAIMGMTDLLLEKTKDPEMLEYLKSIKFSSDNLLVVINDILDFSKLDAGKVSIESIDFNLYEKIEAVSKIFDIRTRAKGLNFFNHIDSSIPEYIKGDPYRLNQILLNLIGNAVKFTSKGDVSITVNKVAETIDHITLRFDIQDTGIGIPENKLDSIFESFSQAYTDITRRFGGTGLGLAITQKLTELQGGKVSVKSEVNVGSTFSVELTYQKSTAPSNEKSLENVNVHTNLSHISILVVEDNDMNQVVLKHILSSWKCNFEIAINGNEAIGILSKKDFDLVLMDLQMPEMSGYEATQFIRNKNTPVRNPLIPIIAITADAFPETKRKVLETGMNDFITKPFDKEELYHKISRLCK